MASAENRLACRPQTRWLTCGPMTRLATTVTVTAPRRVADNLNFRVGETPTGSASGELSSSDCQCISSMCAVGYYVWVLCGCAGASGEGGSVCGCGAARELVHCVAIDDVSDGGELISSGVCGGVNVARQFEEDSQSGVLGHCCH
jgi:hypothetical protein